jgi:hypothetical protein
MRHLHFHLFLPAILTCLTSTALAQDNNASGVEVVSRGPHHRVVNRRVQETLSDGRVVEQVRQYTELGTGLHYWDATTGQYKDTEELIEVVNGFAVAQRGPHKVIFAANPNSPGAVDLESPDGKQFRSHVVGLAYTDADSGRSVIVAEIQDCVGVVVPPNTVVFQSAFSGDCDADIRYRYTKAGLEQDIVIVRAPPPPEAWGLPSATTRLECFTEFIELPEGTFTEVFLKQEPDRNRAAQMMEADLVDQQLDFGAMKFPAGFAFPLDGDSDPFSGNAVPTAKSLTRLEGRTFLIERVDYVSIRPFLDRLPQTAGVGPARIGPAGPRTMMATRSLKHPPMLLMQ